MVVLIRAFPTSTTPSAAATAGAPRAARAGLFRFDFCQLFLGLQLSFLLGCRPLGFFRFWIGVSKRSWNQTGERSPLLPGTPLGPLRVGGPLGCFDSHMKGGNTAEVFMTSEHLVTDFPPVKEYSNRFRAPNFGLQFVFVILAPFQSVPFMQICVVGLVEKTSCGFNVPPSW